jgi:hypothetical protein
MPAANPENAWPPLAYSTLAETALTLQLWTQVVGKVALARTPWLNHAWHVTLRLSARGLATPLLANGATAVQLEFDLLDQRLVVRASDGREQSVALRPTSLAVFYAETMTALAAVGAPTHIVAAPNELAEAVPFAEDHAARAYDPAVAADLWRAMLQIERVFTRFRSRFLGKVSPIHFFWGGADLAMTRFSGRRAPRHPGGVPHLPDPVTREAYSHYAYPTPAGFAQAAVSPPQARFDPALGEFVLAYAAVRGAADPDAVLLSFLQTTYEAAADLAGWDRAALECEEGVIGRPRNVG